MGTGYQLRVTCFKMLCSICMDMWIRGHAVENTSCIVSVIRPKHSRKILAFILRFGEVHFFTRSCEEESTRLLIKPKRSFQ